jgi:hypothetical protein
MTRRCVPLVLLGGCAVSFLWLAIDVSFQMKQRSHSIIPRNLYA